MEEISFFLQLQSFLFCFRFFDGWMFKSKVASMKGGEACVALSFILLFATFNQLCFSGDEPFICGGRAFICKSSGTVPTGGTNARMEDNNSGKKQV